MDQLREAYRNNRLILFVGSGVSANIGLPPWKELIDEIAVQLDYDPEVFNTYGNFLALAEYYRIKKGSIGPLRSWMDREWHRNIEIRDSEIHRLIVRGRFPAIYTTNYDRWLEYAHDAHAVDYIKIANASDLTKARDGIRQIVKFHGDFDDDASIVLDETSYYQRLQFENAAGYQVTRRHIEQGRSVYRIQSFRYQYTSAISQAVEDMERTRDARCPAHFICVLTQAKPGSGRSVETMGHSYDFIGRR